MYYDKYFISIHLKAPEYLRTTNSVVQKSTNSWNESKAHIYFFSQQSGCIANNLAEPKQKNTHLIILFTLTDL